MSYPTIEVCAVVSQVSRGAGAGSTDTAYVTILPLTNPPLTMPIRIGPTDTTPTVGTPMLVTVGPKPTKETK